MQGFEPVTISWQGKSYTVPAERQLMLIARIEDALSGETGEQATTILFRKEGPPHSRLAAAFGAALRFAGGDASDDAIYLSIHEDIAAAAPDRVAEKINLMVLMLLSIISPPIAAKFKQADAPAKNP